MERIAYRTLAVIAIAVCGSVTGCATSPPSQFYVLKAVAPAESVTPSGDLKAPVLVAAVHIPSTLDRQQIVQSSPGNRLRIHGFKRWGAPLASMVQRVLTQDLIERLPGGSVVLPSGPSPSATDRIVVDLLAFQSNTSGEVRLQGSWSLLAPGASVPALIRNVHYAVSTSSKDFNSQAAVMSAMLGRLADDIARSLPRR